MSEIEQTLLMLIVLLGVILIGVLVAMSAAKNRIRQLEADRYFHASDIKRLEDMITGPPKPPDCRLAIDSPYRFYTRTP